MVPDSEFAVLQDSTAISRQNLSQTRQDIRRCALDGGLTEDEAGRFVLAVSEIANNTIEHANSTGQLRILRDDSTSVIAEISDHGPGIPARVPTRPAAEATSGRGLWLARRLADRLDFLVGRGGTLVRVEMFLHRGKPA